MNITLLADSVTVDPSGNRTVSVDLKNVDKDEILDNFTVDDCVAHFGVSQFLASIGKDDCKDHFGLIEDLN